MKYQKLKYFIIISCFIIFSQSAFAVQDAQLKCPPVEKIRQIKFLITWYDTTGYGGWVFVRDIINGLSLWKVYFYSDIEAKDPTDALITGQETFLSLRNEMVDPIVQTGPGSNKCVYLSNFRGNSIFAEKYMTPR